jgi:secreted trypsin-like serine protease
MIDIPISSVVSVGPKKGRGFIVAAEHDSRYIITAAHCLPEEQFPMPDLGNSVNELTWK